MREYYTRACSFIYGSRARKLISQKKALSLNSRKNLAFNSIELMQRKGKKVYTKLIKINHLQKLNSKIKKIVLTDLKKIQSKKKFSKLNFLNEPLLMGVLNITPDSFSDGGIFFNKKKAIKRAKFLINSGADIIDIGGESTRPGSKEISSLVEWNRIKEVVKFIRRKFPKLNISLDTRKSLVMKNGLNIKINIINDVSGLEFDKNSIEVIKKFKSSIIINHMQGEPQTMQSMPKYNNAILDIYDFFEKKISFLKDHNVKINNLILDPGIGFGKNLKHNLMLLSKISLFHSLGFPIMIGTSRKGFINQISGKYDTRERIGGTLSSVLYTMSQGVQIFRVHNVQEVKQGILVFKKLLLD
jgi:dihydropteroate synthase